MVDTLSFNELLDGAGISRIPRNAVAILEKSYRLVIKESSTRELVEVVISLLDPDINVSVRNAIIVGQLVRKYGIGYNVTVEPMELKEGGKVYSTHCVDFGLDFRGIVSIPNDWYPGDVFENSIVQLIKGESE